MTLSAPFIKPLEKSLKEAKSIPLLQKYMTSQPPDLTVVE